MVHAGTYAGGCFLYDLHGTATSPIWIGGADGESPPVIDGGSEGLHLIRARYLILHDLEIRNSVYNGINCDDGGDTANPDAARYLLFMRLNIYDIGGSGNQDGLILSGVDDFFVLDSGFARCGGNDSGSGIDQVGCHHGTIAGCTFASMSGNAIQCKGGSEDVEVRWLNWFIGAGRSTVGWASPTVRWLYRHPTMGTLWWWAMPTLRLRLDHHPAT